MPSIDANFRSIREDRRASYLFSTKTAADAVGLHPNKFGDWWRRNREKLIDLYAAQPAESACELFQIVAEGEARRAAKKSKNV